MYRNRQAWYIPKGLMCAGLVYKGLVYTFGFFVLGKIDTPGGLACMKSCMSDTCRY